MRERLIDFLARLVDDGHISEGKALDIIEQYDDGKIKKVDLSLPPAEFVRGLEDDDDTEAWLAALLLLLGRDTLQASFAQRLRDVDTIQDSFAKDARQYAEKLTEGELTVAQWQRRLFDTYKKTVVQQSLAGLGKEDLTDEQRERLEEKIRTDAAYMSRFADVVAFQLMIDEELSEAYIANRSENYGGTGRGEFFESLGAAVLLLNGGNGWVERYYAVDDRKTCPACVDAGQLRSGGVAYYLPGQGPMPGIICYGRSRCRCRRVPEYNPAIYRQLIGR